jgi:hypothetical protein
VRALVVVALLLLGGGTACSGSGTAKDITISLRIAVWPDGPARGNAVRRWRLGCNPLGGNLPHGDKACYLLAVMARPFAPVRPGTVCTQIYGGPEVARVRGRLRGRQVDAVFDRTNGCEIERWDRVEFLFPKR